MYDDEKSYYLVNPSGTIHTVPESLARVRLQQVGWRMATKDEIATLFRRKGLQTTKSRITPKWSPEPPNVQELPDVAAAKPKRKKAE